MDAIRTPARSVSNLEFHHSGEQRQATVVIKDQRIRVQEGHVGHPDLRVTADSQTWVGFLRNERNVVWSMLRRKIQLDGPLKLLVAFGKCFPSAVARHQVIDILPPPSKIRGEAAPYVKNDPTTKETRWRGKLTLSDVVDGGS